MSTFAARTMHTMAFPHALGTGLLIQSPIDPNDSVTAHDSGTGVPTDTEVHGMGATGMGTTGMGTTGMGTTGIGIDAPASTVAVTPTAARRHSISNHAAIDLFIDEYERALSRFRDDSIVASMRGAAHGGSFDFPDWVGPLFDLYDALVDATDGAIDPCVGEDLIRLGYDARYSFRLSPDALAPDMLSPMNGDAPASGWNLGAIHGRATWRDDVERRGPKGTTLVTRRPIALDFGACGKGYLVDLIAGRFLPPLRHGDAVMHDTADGMPRIDGSPYVIDAGGDLLIRSTAKPLTIAMEDPMNTDNAVGTVKVGAGAFCASAPSRRHWEAAGHRLHHLLNAIDGLPADDVAATWVYVPTDTRTNVAAHPTALADGLATALFTTPATQLHDRLGARAPFQCAILNADRTAAKTPAFPGDFFVK